MHVARKTGVRISMHRTALVAAVAVIVGLTPIADAGGYLWLTGSTPHKWASSVTINTDLGTLGAKTKTQADAMVMSAFNTWALVPNASMTVTQGAGLPVDNTGTDVPGGSAPQYGASGDGYNPVIYDTDGTLIDYALGSGASGFVIGFAGPQVSIGTTITRGQSVLNGEFIDGSPNPTDLSDSEYSGVCIHEFGHFFNLGHTQFNNAFVNNSSADYSGFPTMNPVVHPDISTLELDDEVWFANLYPDAGFSSKTSITGTTRNTANNATSGINVIARSTTSPVGDVVSCVSGAFNTVGNFLIPGLPPETTWVLDFEPILTQYTSGSRVGLIDPPLAIASPLEYLNEVGLETASDDVKRSTTFITPASGALAGVDLRLNTPPTGTPIAEVDGGATFPTQATNLTSSLTVGVPLVVNGSVSDAGESGNVVIGVDDIEDWYVLSPSVGVEVTKVTVDPVSTDIDLYVVEQVGPGSLVVRGGSYLAGSSTEVVIDYFDTSKMGTGDGAGKVFIAVTAYNGVGLGNYTMTIETAVADSAAVMVTGVSGSLNPESGSVVIQGRGFKSSGGTPPTVTFSDPNITVNTVTLNSATQLTVAVTAGPGFTPGSCDITVQNPAGVYGYSGIRKGIVTVPVELSEFAIE